MKKVFLLIVVLFCLFSCKQEESANPILYQKPLPEKEQFGFNFNDFNVLHDTIKRGDTFGSIIENQNLGDKQVYNIIAKVKDSFDVRTVRIGKSYTFLRSKDRYKKLQFLVYQTRLCGYTNQFLVWIANCILCPLQ